MAFVHHRWLPALGYSAAGGGHTFDRAEAAEAQNKKQNDQAGRQNAECQKPFAILRLFQWPVSHDDFSNFVCPTKP
jgi:hypothetical protein